MGGGDHGHGHGHGEHEIVKVPDYKTYKIDGLKELEEVQKKLAAKGLKDPWLRNEVWRYTPDNYKGIFRNMFYTMSKGFKWAALAMVITIGVDNYFGITKSRKQRFLNLMEKNGYTHH